MARRLSERERIEEILDDNEHRKLLEEKNKLDLFKPGVLKNAVFFLNNQVVLIDLVSNSNVSGRIFLSQENIYETPIPSSKLNTYKCKQLANATTTWRRTDFKTAMKCMVIPSKRESYYFVIPLLHYETNKA